MINRQAYKIISQTIEDAKEMYLKKKAEAEDRNNEYDVIRCEGALDALEWIKRDLALDRMI